MCEFFKKQLEIVLDALPDEWNSIRKAMQPRLSFIEFNPLTDEMLLERDISSLRGSVSILLWVYVELAVAQDV